MTQRAIIIGGGAAGFFCAIQLKTKCPSLEVIIFEKNTQVLNKVKVSGGGRCNVTNAEVDIKKFSENYPRGSSQMAEYLKIYSNKDFINWLASKNIKTKVEKDNRIFPVSDNSQTIIDCLLKECKQLNIDIQTKKSVHTINKQGEQYLLTINDNEYITCNYLIIATGGANDIKYYKHIQSLAIKITPILPSLFTLNAPKSTLTTLMGISADGSIYLNQQKKKQKGPILITHWGVSGPAVLKLSAFEAEFLNQSNYQETAIINWTNFEEPYILSYISEYRTLNPKKNVRSIPLFNLPSRLWDYFCNECSVAPFEKWAEFGNKKLKQLTSLISAYKFEIKGKTTFKEEFVTCGGVEWNEINEKTLELHSYKNIYCCGEVLNIDGITGGFNFQAAWSTAYVVASSIQAKVLN
jgi:predicted Rossmann fold flavoprotein